MKGSSFANTDSDYLMMNESVISSVCYPPWSGTDNELHTNWNQELWVITNYLFSCKKVCAVVKKRALETAGWWWINILSQSHSSHRLIVSHCLRPIRLIRIFVNTHPVSGGGTWESSRQPPTNQYLHTVGDKKTCQYSDVSSAGPGINEYWWLVCRATVEERANSCNSGIKKIPRSKEFDVEKHQVECINHKHHSK